MPANDLVQIRKGTSSEWAAANPILASGEPGYDITNKFLKVGDASSNWSTLPSLGLPHYPTNNYIPKWSNNTLSSSLIYDNGTNIGIATNSPADKLTISSGNISAGNGEANYKIQVNRTGASSSYIAIGAYTGSPSVEWSGSSLRFEDRSSATPTERLRINNLGHLGVGTNSPTARLNVEGGSIIFNDLGADHDFRVEGDTDQNLLFVDASADDVGIGTNTPVAKLHIAGDTLFENLSYRRFTTATATSTHFRKYYDIIHYANSVSSIAGSLRIEIPVTTTTMWSMDVVIIEYDGVNASNIKTTNLIITGYTTNNLNRGVWTNNPSRISQVRFGRNTANNRTVILIDPVSVFRHPKAYIKEINTHYTNETTFSNSANYAMTITSDETNFTLNGTITNDQFVRDDKLVNTFGNQIITGNKTFNGNVIINEIGDNFDFRVEGDTDENLLFIDASTDRVGIGVSLPQAKLDVRGSLSANNIVTLGSGSIPIPRRPVEILNHTNIDQLSVRLRQNAQGNWVSGYTFPTADGLSGQSLVTNGSGTVSWTSLTNINRGSFTPLSGQSSFTVNDGYVVGGLDVYYNGIKLLSGTDYTATNGTSFTLTNTAVSGDIIEYVALSAASMDANTIRGSVAASDGQTTFNVSGGYTVGNLDVFLNGIKLLDGTDFTATNGTSITLTSAAALGDVLEYNAYGLVVASNGLQKTGDTMTGNLTLGSNSILFDSSVIDNNSLDINICNGRLTLESGVPVSTSDQTAKTTLYFAPYNGNRICLYDTSLNKWKMHSFSQLSLSLSGLVANTNYDVFIYNNSGTLILETTAWTDNTTRATELTTQDNIYVKTGSVNRRYLGTIRTTNTAGQCEDSVTKRFVWNYYNREERLLRKYIYGSWTYATAAWRVFAGAAASTYSIDVVTGLSQDSIFLKAGALYTAGFTTLTYYYIAIAQDSSLNIIDIGNTNNAVERVQSNSSNQTQLESELDHIVPLGYHYYYPIEYRESGGTPTMYATDTTYWGGLLGTWRC